MINRVNEVGLLIILMCLSGCATIVSGTTQKLSVTSQPSDAVAKVDNSLSAKTPTVFNLERKSDHTIEISKDGYKTTTVMLRKTLNGMAVGNVVLGGLIGTGIDMASGADNKLIPERVDVVLEPGSGSSDMPQFMAQQDQEFYEKNILKVKKVEPVKMQAMSKTMPAVSTQTNFGPKKMVS